MTASESDFPFNDYENELQGCIPRGLIDDFEGHALTSRNDDVPLVSRGNDDPFYQAQLLAKDLDLPNFSLPKTSADLAPTTPIRSILGSHAVEQLNGRYNRTPTSPRLAVYATILEVLLHNNRSDWWEDEAKIHGTFDGFEYTDSQGEMTIVARFDAPRFINPDYIEDGYAKRLRVPVLAIQRWSHDLRQER